MTEAREFTQEQARAMYRLIAELSAPDLDDPRIPKSQFITLAKVANLYARALMARLDSDLPEGEGES